MLKDLLAELEIVRERALEMEARFEGHIREAHPDFRASARNLLHYLALRNFDIRELQASLAALGLSSLGRTESHTLATLDAVLRVLRALADGSAATPVPRPHLDDFEQGEILLHSHTQALLGLPPERRSVRIMVTLPSEAAADYALVRALLAAGMDCARINCAHDDEAAWERMAANIHAARAELARECRILMDLGGPKARTGPLQPGARVVHLRPRRDSRGQVITRARAWLAAPGSLAATDDIDAVLPVDAKWLEAVREGDCVELRDARGKRRKLRITACRPHGCLAECARSAYIETGTPLTLRHGKAAGAHATHKSTTAVGDLPPVARPILLRAGETLVLQKEPANGVEAVRDDSGRVLVPARITCTLAEAFGDVRVGEAVMLDDGQIGAIVRTVTGDEIHLEITQARAAGSRLGADKGINFPESRLRVKGLTDQDLADLDFAARRADIIGLSFVREPEDVYALQAELAKRGASQVGILLKIETRRGFEQLPWLMLAAMRSYPAGVMIARGDLAVECGWERLAEVQEEILWLCEAAHTPVVWATQVLENLAKTGFPSRAEITDAAMSQRAECVMLNKGPHIVQAIQTLAGILERMQAHQTKKTSTLRSLKVSDMLGD